MKMTFSEIVLDRENTTNFKFESKILEKNKINLYISDLIEVDNDLNNSHTSLESI